MPKRKIDEWEVNGAIDTLQRAEEIMKDKTLMPHIKRQLKKKTAAINKVARKISRKKWPQKRSYIIETIKQCLHAALALPGRPITAVSTKG